MLFPNHPEIGSVFSPVQALKTFTYPHRHLLRHLAGLLSLFLCLVAAASCQRPQGIASAGASTPAGPVSVEVQQVLTRVEPERIKSHVHYLADDLLEGRKPGTRGFDLASRYVETQFQGMGLQPAGEENSFRQTVLLRKGQVVEEESVLVISRSQSDHQTLAYERDYLLNANLLNTRSQVAVPVVFVGFGISAPELGYDDYANTDVKGKLVAYFGHAPASFPNNERAHFAREYNKQALAAERGAVGTILLSPTEPAGSVWQGMLNRARSGPHGWVDDKEAASNTFPQIQVSAHLNLSGMTALFAGAPKSVGQVIAAARAGQAQSFELPVTVQIRSRTKHKLIRSNNVVGLLPGSDATLRNEYVVYAAHLDHLGIGTPVQGDSIFNGAHDNASGVGMLLEIARSFTRLPQAPRRSILFLGVTGEEMGLLGSDYFASHPTVPAGSMVANMSIDMAFFFYPLLDIVPHGIQHSSLKKPVEEAARHLGIAISPDPAPEQVVFVRSDHYSFIRQGIPSLFIKGGYQTGDPNVDGSKIQSAWRTNIYHTPLDNLDQPFDYGAAAKHVQTNFLVGYLVANQTERPAWNKGDFFGERFGRKNLPE